MRSWFMGLCADYPAAVVAAAFAVATAVWVCSRMYAALRDERAAGDDLAATLDAVSAVLSTSPQTRTVLARAAAARGDHYGRLALAFLRQTDTETGDGHSGHA